MEKIIGIPVTLNKAEFLCAGFKENDEEAICIYKGATKHFTNNDVLVRIHSGCVTSEVFGMENCDCKWQLERSLEIISVSSAGIIVYLPGQEGKGNGLYNKIKSFELQNIGLRSSDAYELIGLPSDARQFDFAIQILKTFEVKSIKLITNSPAKIKACVEGGIVVSERIPIVIDNPSKAIWQLLENKRRLYNHFIN